MTDSKAFGKMLLSLQLSKGISNGELSSKTGASKSTISEWVTGAKTPNRTYAHRIVDALKLDSKQAIELLSLAGHDYSEEIIPDNVYRPSGIVIDAPGKSISSKIDNVDYKIFREVLARSLESINQIDTKINATPASKNQELRAISSEIRTIRDDLSQMKIPSAHLSAPIILPPPEDMEVRLVSSTSLQRLEEYRSEENKWYSVTGIFMGAILGIAINVATGGIMTNNAWILVGTFVALTILTGITAIRYQNQGNRIRTQILKPHISQSKEDAMD